MIMIRASFKAERNLEITKLKEQGLTDKYIAERFRISPSRVSQIVEKMKRINVASQEQDSQNAGSLHSLGLSVLAIRLIRFETKSKERINTLIDLQRFLESNPDWKSSIRKKLGSEGLTEELIREIEEFARVNGIRITSSQ